MDTSKIYFFLFLWFFATGVGLGIRNNTFPSVLSFVVSIVCLILGLISSEL